MEGPDSKNELRRKFRALRRNLDPLQREARDRSINDCVVSLIADTGAKSVSAFLAFDGEPDLRPALDQLSRSGVMLVLPAIVNDAAGKKTLEFRRWHPGAQVSRNSFGIDEPDPQQPVHVREIDVLLIPLVAWDPRGNRLGMGAGYYDHALAALGNSGRPRRIGVGYSIQRTDELNAQPWDVRLHEVITEYGRFTCTT